MPIIKLDATGSTNDFLRDLLKETRLDDFTIVWSDFQHSGRGQRGRTWQSEKGKNLIISILKLHKGVAAKDQFSINRVVSLAVIQTLSDLNIPKLAIKWPNDILSGNRKLCGLLIENSIKGSKLSHSIIGLGLNVNQERFENLPKAASLLQISGETYDRDILLYQLLNNLKAEMAVSDHKGFMEQKERYTKLLFQSGKEVTFQHDDATFKAIVDGVTDTGELRLLLENGKTKSYAKGEIRWLPEAG